MSGQLPDGNVCTLSVVVASCMEVAVKDVTYAHTMLIHLYYAHHKQEQLTCIGMHPDVLYAQTTATCLPMAARCLFTLST